ncbi:MAG: ABC transporter substrate-binding protein, partial [Polyangiaceae bacterium]|nr:ABC transporter substrate-binding protein [Polyangiaceae bacterium]
KHPTVELALGRDLVLELTETQADYDTKVLEYFQQEIEHKNANPSYQMVDWIWMANTSKTTAYLGKSLQKVRDQLGLTNVQMITNTWGFDEMLYGLCGSPCVGIVHGILPFKAYVDASDDLKALHNKWRAVDAAADADAELPGSYENVRYVQGHVSVLMWKTAVERVVDSGIPVTGENLRAALEGFRDVPMFNLSAAVSFTSADHRPQSTVSFYKIGAGGTIVHEPPERTISLQPSWLGW